MKKNNQSLLGEQLYLEKEDKELLKELTDLITKYPVNTFQILNKQILNPLNLCIEISDIDTNI